MKTSLKSIYILLALVAVSCLYYTQPPTQLSFQEAVDKGLIKVKIRGYDSKDVILESGNGYAPTLEILAENKSTKDIEITLPAGHHFESEDPGFQDMLVSESLILALNASARKKFPVYTMCTQVRNAGPGEGTYYKTGKMAEGNLLAVAQYLDSHAMHGDHIGQEAVWAVSDHTPIYFSKDHTELQQLISGFTGMEILHPGEGETVVRQRRIKSYTLKGQVEYNLNASSHVTLQMLDSTGVPVKILRDNEPRNRGKHTSTYVFTWKEGKYKMQLLVNGVVKSEDEFVLGES